MPRSLLRQPGNHLPKRALTFVPYPAAPWGIASDRHAFINGFQRRHSREASIPTRKLLPYEGRRSSEFVVVHRGRVKSRRSNLRGHLQLRAELRCVTEQRNAALEALDRLETAAIIVDAACFITFANAYAADLLRAGDAVAERGGKLIASSASAHSKLARLIRAAAKTKRGQRTSPGGVVLLPGRDASGPSAWIGALIAGHPVSGANSASALVLIRDGKRIGKPSPTHLCDLFGLTSAEADVVVGLADGLSLEQISELRGTSMNTLRSQLKSVMAKAGARRQGELIALVLKSVAVIGGRAGS